MKKTFMKLTSALMVAVMALMSANVQAGCNDPSACNYNAADTDALDCVFEGFTLTVGGSIFDAELGWELLGPDSVQIDLGIAYVDGAPTIRTYCLPDTCYHLVMTDAFGDGWDNGTAVFTSYDGLTTYYTATGPADGVGPDTIQVSVGTTGCTVLGCIDPGACNFDAAANQDDGLQCEYTSCAGCTDPAFCEYDPAATISDFAQCLTTIGCFDPLSCLFDPSAGCGDQLVLCAQAVNDTCANATDLGPLGAGVTTIAGATNEGTCFDELTFNGETGGVWWTFTTPATAGDMIVTITALDNGNGPSDLQFELTDGCGGITLGFNDDANGSVMPELVLDCGVLAPSTQYWLMMDGFFGATGNVDIDINIDDATCITGCTNPLALNFDPTALIPCDDGGGPNDCCVVPDCPDPATNNTYCYDSGEASSWLWLENDPLESVILSFNAGQIENDIFDIITIYDGIDNTGAVLYTNLGSGGTVDLTGLIVESTAGSGGIYMELTTDASVSCVSGSFIAWDWDIYCGTEAIPGCMDPLAINFDPLATFDDGSCVVPTCVDPSANYTYCYDNNEDGSILFGFGPLTPADAVILSFNAGQVENPIFDVITITGSVSGLLYDNTAAGGTTDLTGLVIAGAPGENITISLLTDASVSCTSGAMTAWDWDVYCGVQLEYGCDDPAACNYSDTGR